MTKNGFERYKQAIYVCGYHVSLCYASDTKQVLTAPSLENEVICSVTQPSVHM